MNKMWYRAPIPLLNHPFKITWIRLAALLHLHQLSLTFAVYYFQFILEISQLSDHLVLCPGCFYSDISEVKKANIVYSPAYLQLILKCLVLYILKKTHVQTGGLEKLWAHVLSISLIFQNYWRCKESKAQVQLQATWSVRTLLTYLTNLNVLFFYLNLCIGLFAFNLCIHSFSLSCKETKHFVCFDFSLYESMYNTKHRKGKHILQ